MYIEVYSATNHKPHIVEWLQHHDVRMAADSIPETGMVVLERGTPIAAGFLRRCEGDVAIFDGLVTDPNADSSQRNQALDALVLALIDKAKELKLKGIIAWTRDKNTLMRGLKHGFVSETSTVLALNLSDKA